MNVLVTGGAGYVGSHTCKALAKGGHRPVTVDNLVCGHEWAVKWGPLYKNDVRETVQLIEIIKKEKIEAVIHFAAFAYVGESMIEPLKYFDNNVGGTLSLLTAMQSTGVNKIVFSSTCSTYGVPKEIPIREETPQQPINPYGRSKLIVEQILKDLAQAEVLSAICLRYFNAAGADPDLEIGEDHSPETHLIPNAVAAIFDKGEELAIFGDDYPTPDGTCVRDYIHVADLASGHLLALDRLQKLSVGSFDAYNLGTGEGCSVKRIVDYLNEIVEHPVKVKRSPRRPGDPPTLVASCEKAKAELKWRPQHSQIKQILETAVNWYKKHHLAKKKRAL